MSEGVKLVGIVLSMALHGALLVGMARIEPERTDRGPSLVRMRLREPPPPPPEVKAPEPPPPKPKPKPKPKLRPPPPPEVKPKKVKARTVEEIVPNEPPPAKPPPGFAIDMSNTVEAGEGVEVRAVEGGSNMFADPKDAKEPPKQRVTSPPPPSGQGTGGPPGAYQITEEPRFLSSEDERTPPYPPEAKFRQVEGVVLLRVYVNELGRVARVRVLRRLGAGTDEIAAKWAKEKWRFSPAKAGAEPVGMWITVPVRFVLDR